MLLFLAVAGMSLALARRSAVQQQLATPVLAFPDCKDVAPESYPGFCASTSAYACYSSKDSHEEEGHGKIEIQWACSEGSNMGDISDENCRQRPWEYHYTLNGTEVSHAVQVYEGACQFGPVPVSTTGSTTELEKVPGGSTSKVSASTTKLIDSTTKAEAPDSTTKAEAPESTTKAEAPESTTKAEAPDSTTKINEEPAKTTERNAVPDITTTPNAARGPVIILAHSTVVFSLLLG
mmetsp:Transcript_16806/g.39406  ORF Transcript_16806/g.39406 Transcript_16806/m.39406 type:complete len:236 (-) Transcript_16806:129-836(-)|eukprot:CAMPEP_0171094024 /NCGR_PEP_ID=MMETSP0766_2-20121228/39632_1 /TAXON_ID=439317 /ORGANISM="Gambierdiscus australes, Strain CAWD 149" /LENGTH=235 /DNA_ID=CAMNT_0011552561 /DNA_START=66 /DNA_END=773 /DNA_ORIENTATION=-